MAMERGPEDVVTSEDDMKFFRTLFKYTSKLSEFDNFEFREQAMKIVKEYAYKQELAKLKEKKELEKSQGNQEGDHQENRRMRQIKKEAVNKGIGKDGSQAAARTPPRQARILSSLDLDCAIDCAKLLSALQESLGIQTPGALLPALQALLGTQTPGRKRPRNDQSPVGDVPPTTLSAHEHGKSNQTPSTVNDQQEKSNLPPPTVTDQQEKSNVSLSSVTALEIKNEEDNPLAVAYAKAHANPDLELPVHDLTDSSDEEYQRE